MFLRASNLAAAGVLALVQHAFQAMVAHLGESVQMQLVVL
jgi:hypothetical protein